MIALEDIESHTIPLENHPMKSIFEQGGKISPEFSDQIWPLTPKASNDLWDFESRTRIFKDYPKMTDFFQEVDVYDSSSKSDKEIKKWLHNRGIPYSTKVFWIHQPNCGFMLTWKMVIKHSDNIFFANDETIWNLTMNWGLAFHHDDEFRFGKNRIYDESDKQIEITKVLRDLEEKLNRESDSPKVYQ